MLVATRLACLTPEFLPPDFFSRGFFLVGACNHAIKERT